MRKKAGARSRLAAIGRRVGALKGILRPPPVQMAILATISFVLPELFLEDEGLTLVSQIAGVGLVFLFIARSQKLQDLGVALVSGGMIGAALFLMQADFQVDLLLSQREHEATIRDIEGLSEQVDSVEDCVDDHQQDIRHVQSVLAQQRDLREIDLSFQTVFGRFLTDRDMRRANLSSSDLAAILFKRVNLNGALLIRANLHTVGFANSSLRNAILNRASLSHVDFRTANLTGASFKGATYDRRTKWPEGFTPERHGAVLGETKEPPTDPCSHGLRRLQKEVDALL